jgi:hypothetical protein
MCTRVEPRTFFKRGKSRIPESRIEIDESRREREERREETDAEREERDCDCAGACCEGMEERRVVVLFILKTGECGWWLWWDI